MLILGRTGLDKNQLVYITRCKMKKRKGKFSYIIAALLILGLFGVANQSSEESIQKVVSSQVEEQDRLSEDDVAVENTSQNKEEAPVTTNVVKKKKSSKKKKIVSKSNTFVYNDVSYKIIDVDGGDRSGYREALVAVDIGFGDREYWGLTNEYGQLVYVLADEIILQDDRMEPVTSSGRYYADEANVPGTERRDLDQGHVIADSLGGVSNAYNITPQDSTLNRHGDQAYMEKVIRDAGGCTNFVATITYPDTSTQIPSKYKYEYTLRGKDIVDEFPNANPEKSSNRNESTISNSTSTSTSFDEQKELAIIDTNGNGKVTIKEAKDAGYSMPIYSDHWLYKYMDDRDHDGLVGE